MYRKPSPQLTIDDFILPFSGKLDPENRWVQLANIIPWDEYEKEYAHMFPSDRGNVAKPVRMALGTLIIQARCGYTDRETVQQITENPYLQWFIGLKEFQLTRPLTPVALVKFRKRFKKDRMAKINERIALAERAAKTSRKGSREERDDDQQGPNLPDADKEEKKTPADSDSEESKPNQGTLILDATCTPADIKYPTDLGLLNESREKLDEIIDTLHKAKGKATKRPRTYREKARKAYLSVSKQRSPRKKQLRKGIKQQLQYCKRNLRHVDQMLKEIPSGFEALSNRQVKLLETIRTVIEQQETMYKTKQHQIPDRIVNLYQDHVRPIVRGKASAKVEFGAKVAISIEKGFCRIEKLSWDAFNEAETLIDSVERYRARNGCYPEAVLADKIYRNRKNLAYCKNHNIRLSGPKLGRPSGDALKKVEKAIERMDAKMRNAVEGKFGEGKRKYGLDRVYAKLKETAECMISMQFFVMNLEHKLRVLFVQILKRYFQITDIGVFA
ncbi:LOW QUALITY PROTEIN: transposase family protein [Desulfosporosinus youngiae DSM 17734]|uniref:Transposase family protein n=1 Tax=Desulfosporosinus youngiae DSM 17734 TaxID=768710 RepID=H5XWX9_9FIRM|nr:LOW QUALITY PROTEIN: transposase family protein [Desulfosporosinus youngiae DSM 17734]